MKPASVLKLALACSLCWASFSQVTNAQKPTVVVTDWNAELEKAKAAIKKNPKSAFWHNQAGVAYNALGDFKSAVKEIKFAITLDPSDPINYYTLYSVYQRQGMHSEQRQVLLDALEQDDSNALGHFQFGQVLEEEKYWGDSLREYQTAKRLAAAVTGPVYTDPSGNAYTITAVRAQVDNAIERVAKLNETSNETYSPSSDDETEILSLVLNAEFQTNKWKKNELICFSVKGLDPSPKLVKTLRQHLNVCSSAEWRKKFNCGFELRIEYPSFGLSQGKSVRVQVVDNREINQGTGDLALLLRDVEYTLHKTNGKWFISDCVPAKQP